MGDLIIGLLICLGVVLAIVASIVIAVMPIIACYRTRRLNHIHDQLNEIIKLLGGEPDDE